MPSGTLHLHAAIEMLKRERTLSCMIELIQNKFRGEFQTDPVLAVRSPGRINLIGEHTDYNLGYVMPAAIDKSIFFAVGPRTDNECHLIAIDLQEKVVVPLDNITKRDTETWANYLLGVVLQMQQAGKAIKGFNLVFGGDLPGGGGMSSSAAIENGIGFALNELFQLGFSRIDLLKMSQQAENQFVGMQCGIMDMFASMMGHENAVIRLDCRNLDFEYFPFEAPDCSLVLCDSGVKHQLVDSEYNTRRLECEEGIRVLSGFDHSIKSLRDVSPAFLEQHQSNLREVVYRRCKYVVEEIERVEEAGNALKNGDFEKFGRLMYATHKGLDEEYAVSCTELNFLVEQAKKDGNVLGARMMGGGFGGCTINLVKTAGLDQFLQNTSHAYQATFGRKMQVYKVALKNGTSLEN